MSKGLIDLWLGANQLGANQMTGNQRIGFALFLWGKKMSKDVNMSNLASSVDYQWLVSVMEG